MRAFTRRQFARLGTMGFGALALAPGFTRAASTADGATPYIDPELQTVLKAFQQRMSAVQNASNAADRQRAMAAAQVSPTQAPAGWTERTIPGPAGAPDVRVFVFNGTGGGTPRPAILHMHGGGYTGGTPRLSMPQLTPMGTALDCVIVSVDYRLAPGAHLSGSLEDNYAGLKWLYKNAAELGVDTSRIAVMGESAGGGHAAMLAIAARNRGEVPVMYQALVYPMLDDRTGSSRKVPPHLGQFIWTAAQNRDGWTKLLGVPAGSPKVPAGVPSRLDDVRGLPPAYIGVGSLDLFLDEDITYAQRLLDAGIAAELVIFPGAFHGFDIIAPNAAVSKRLQTSVTDALRRAFTPKA